MSEKNMFEADFYFTFKKDKPVLTGLAVQNFGWIIGGGNHNGDLKVTCKVSLDDLEYKDFDEKQTKKFKKAMKNFDYVKNGHRVFDVKGE